MWIFQEISCILLVTFNQSTRYSIHSFSACGNWRFRFCMNIRNVSYNCSGKYIHRFLDHLNTVSHHMWSTDIVVSMLCAIIACHIYNAKHTKQYTTIVSKGTVDIRIYSAMCTNTMFLTRQVNGVDIFYPNNVRRSGRGNIDTYYTLDRTKKTWLHLWSIDFKLVLVRYQEYIEYSE